MRGLILVIASLAATNALADTQFYVGGGLGLTKFEQGDGDITGNADVKFDDDDTGITLFAGYEITERWAVEGGYIDFGDARDSGDRTINPPPGSGLPPITIENSSRIDYEFDGYYVNGQYHIPVGGWGSVDLVGGVIFADSRAEISLIQGDEFVRDRSASESDEGLLLGTSLTVKLTDTIYLRGTAMYYDIDFDNTLEEPLRLGADVIWDF